MFFYLLIQSITAKMKIAELFTFFILQKSLNSIFSLSCLSFIFLQHEQQFFRSQWRARPFSACLLCLQMCIFTFDLLCFHPRSHFIFPQGARGGKIPFLLCTLALKIRQSRINKSHSRGLDEVALFLTQMDNPIKALGIAS